MGAPYPPQGQQQSHTERPLKVYAEQYVLGQPLPVGTSTEVIEPVYADGRPRVYADRGTFDLHVGEWVISSRYTGRPVEVISAEEFAERFGPSEL
jgi:hypothetical protein